LPFTSVPVNAESWVISGRALKPLQKLTAVTRRVTAEGLSQRIQARGEDQKFAGPVEVFNNMLVCKRHRSANWSAKHRCAHQNKSFFKSALFRRDFCFILVR
jgi:nitrogen fixation/metabolism regulation signal transduction histidine kinase